jgi:hypothetical protein
MLMEENSWEHVDNRIGSMMHPDEYFWLRNGIKYDYNRIYTNELGCIDFSGRYPDNLIEEISNYEAVASVLAHQIDFDELIMRLGGYSAEEKVAYERYML